MLTLDPIARKRLVIAKQVYQKAVGSVGYRASVSDRILAILEFDFSIETALKTVVYALQKDKVPAKEFQALVQQCNDVLAKNNYAPLPDVIHIQYVHEFRNDAQHKAKYPGESEVSDCRTYTKDFLAAIIANVWDVSFESISLVDIVQQQEIKQQLLTAEESLQAGDLEGSTQYSALAMGTLLRHVKRLLIERDIGHSLDTVLKRDFRDLLASLEKMRDLLVYTALGMDYAEYLRFRSVVGEAGAYADGKPMRHPGTEPVDARNAEYALAYCVNTVIEVEERVGSLDVPYGVYRRKWV